MSLLVTGGLGFLGLQVARQFLKRGKVWSPRAGCAVALERITLFDVPGALHPTDEAGGVPAESAQAPHAPLQGFRLVRTLSHVSLMRLAVAADDRVAVRTGDLTEEGVADELVDDDSLAVVHLASMVSGDTEADHMRGWDVNVEGQRRLLEALRTRAPGSRFVFTSSTAALGPVAPGDADADDLTKLLPQNTYG